MRVLVTGGAGFVGSIICEVLLRNGHEVIVLDNLQQGHQEAVPAGVQFIRVDICDSVSVEEVFRQSEIEAVMHMAAETVVECSVTDPKRYFENNIVGGINLLNTMLRHGVLKLIFSSSAAVYGEPQSTPIEEGHPKNPINAYGETKIMFEQILAWYGKAYRLRHISFRYFNAAGASDLLGEDHCPETHLIPNVLRGALTGDRVSVFGTDYPTRDGSCLRDYVHVLDIASAHVLALEGLDHLGSTAYNLGNETGYSVIEVIEAAKRVTDVDIAMKKCPRRAGDPAVLVASSSKAKSQLGWQPRYSDLEAMIGSAWEWMNRHPQGYSDSG